MIELVPEMKKYVYVECNWTTMDGIVQNMKRIAKKVKDQANYTRVRELNRKEKSIFLKVQVRVFLNNKQTVVTKS